MIRDASKIIIHYFAMNASRNIETMSGKQNSNTLLDLLSQSWKKN
jgi:hypothetical protein